MVKKKRKGTKKPKKKIYLWLFLLCLFAVSMVAFFYFIFLRPGTISTVPTYTASEYADDATIIIEEPQRPVRPHHVLTPGAIKIRPTKAKKPRIAIVIDDMGYQKKIPRQLLALELNLSFAFLPYGPDADYQLAQATKKRRDILLHLPMEAQDSKWDAGKGALLTSMNGKKIAETLTQNLTTVPAAIGVNNHMGSRFTEVKPVMKDCLQVLRQKNMFFLDSLTTSKSTGFQIAKELGVKTAKRDIFLDNVQTTAAISKQLEALIRIAKKHGSAIGIGHPYQATADALRANQALLQKEVTLVGVSELMK